MTEDEFKTLFVRAARSTARKEVDGLSLDDKISSFGIDSVSMLELVCELEDALGVRLADDQLSRVRLVRDLFDLFVGARPGN